MPQPQDSLEETTRGSAEMLPAAVPRRIPGFTLLWHPETTRIGERVACTELTAGRAVSVSRLTPLFAPASGGSPAPLAVSTLSRRPFYLHPRAGGLELDITDSPIRIETADGLSLTASENRYFSPADLESGTILILARSVVVLLHLMDPLGAETTQSFGLLGVSAEIAAIRSQIERLADLDVTILVRGETGTGKELVAQALHTAGQRASGPFIAADMGALPASLAASELFGTVKGAFTGAGGGRSGLWRSADGGTLFLDEIGEAPPEVQAMLLRVLETGIVRPVGGDRGRRVNARLVSATDADLEQAVEAGRFRAPLLHRLAAVPLNMPSLRRRRDDIGVLLHHFLDADSIALGVERPALDARSVARLAAYDWPGNVRQLRNVVRQLLVASGRDSAAEATRVSAIIESLVRTPVTTERGSADRQQTPPERSWTPPAPKARPPSQVDDAELIATLEACQWQPTKAAARLGISRASLYNRMRADRRIRIASELKPAEIEAAHDAFDGDLESMALHLRVSRRALARRLAKDSG